MTASDWKAYRFYYVMSGITSEPEPTGGQVVRRRCELTI
jgi:hypothetical protein